MPSVLPVPEAKAAFQALKGAIEPVVKPFGFEVRSSGFGPTQTEPAVNDETGFWLNTGVTSKPPRWLLHISPDLDPPVAGLAKDAQGDPFPGAGTPGYINNGQGNCVAAIFRIAVAVARPGSPSFILAPGWEWVVAFTFSGPLPEGTSSDTLTDFDSAGGTLSYKGRGEKSAVRIARIFLTPIAPEPTPMLDVPGLTYAGATAAIEKFLGAGAPLLRVAAEVDDLATVGRYVADALQQSVAAATSGRKKITKAPHLFGVSDLVYDLINASLATGKRHFILYGPPGTGKTTLAEHIAGQLVNTSAADDVPYLEMTGSSSWSSQELVGGYQPIGGGEVGFMPGAMLRDFSKPIIIDELNRCPIDKVLGPLFSVLSGNPSDLPYRVDIKDANSRSYKILPRPKDNLLPHEFAPGPDWAMICTLNQMDKTQIGQISYALTRRFVWIRLGVPQDLSAFVLAVLERRSLVRTGKTASQPASPVADMWKAVNQTRELGGAPIIDFISLMAEMRPGHDFLAAVEPSASEVFVACLTATVMPLLDGIRLREAEDLGARIRDIWHLDGSSALTLQTHLRELAV